MEVIYPAIFTYIENYYLVIFPDFDVATQGENILDIFKKAKDLLEITCLDYLKDKKDLPIRTNISDLNVSNSVFAKDGISFKSYVITTINYPQVDICPMLTISTSHLKPETIDLIDDIVEQRINDDSDIENLDIVSGDTSFFIYIPENLNELKLPRDLMACLSYAKAREVSLLCLDAYGKTLLELPSYI